MCGLAGLWSPGRDPDYVNAAAQRMADTIAHRGPDDSGTWVEPSAGVGLGFRRLAIIDLTALGHQPMKSASGRFTMIFNGEVYNFADMRRELEALGARFRGHSDSEVILAAFEAWGIPASVRRFVGMFAIAVWDGADRSLHLIRDRLGIKPVFVAQTSEGISFGSELKVLLAGPSFDRALDVAALTTYLRYLYVPAPATIFQKVSKLLPGHILTIRDPRAPLGPGEAFWSADGAAEQGRAHPFTGSDDEAVEELDRLLAEAVRLRMISDVPLGSLLSGGVDSSVVTALMQKQSSRPVRTYSIGFDDPAYDEGSHAAKVAAHLGTEHTSLRLTGQDALDVVPGLAQMFDEPLADPSQIPTYLVCRLARRDVTVALSGDGGDELFAGYNRYTYGESLVQRLLSVPVSLRRMASAGISAVAPDNWSRLHAVLSPALPGTLRQRLAGEKLHKVSHLLGEPTAADMYRSLMSSWRRPADVVVGGREEPDVVSRIVGGNGSLDLISRMQLADQVGYLADDLLAKVDRASMVSSLEARVPILDHRVVEFSWRLPRRMKVRGRQGKWILRRVLHRYVPDHLVERPKMGFSVPIDAWLRGALRPWAEALIQPERLAREGSLDPAVIQGAWTAFQSGRTSDGLALWAVVMFQAWRERWLS